MKHTHKVLRLIAEKEKRVGKRPLYLVLTQKQYEVLIEEAEYDVRYTPRLMSLASQTPAGALSGVTIIPLSRCVLPTLEKK